MIEIKLNNSKSLSHKGIKAELHGIVEKYGSLNAPKEFLFLTRDIIPAGEIYQEKTLLEFNFKNPYIKYESYKGSYASVKYYIKVIIDSTFTSSTYEKEFAVVNPNDDSVLYENDFPIKLKVGVKNVVSMLIEFDHCNYNCRGILKGYVTFNLVNANVQFMEVQLVKREVIFDGKKYEPEYLARYELIDGGPTKHERIPLRLFLKSYNLTPSYPDVEGIFGVKYFLNLIVADDNDNRYFKYAELNLHRLFRDKRAHMQYFDNDGLYISEPFFEKDYHYVPEQNKNNNRNDNYNDNDYDNYNDNYNNDFNSNNNRNNYNKSNIFGPDNNNNNNLRSGNKNRNNNQNNNNYNNRRNNDFNDNRQNNNYNNRRNNNDFNDKRQNNNSNRRNDFNDNNYNNRRNNNDSFK